MKLVEYLTQVHAEEVQKVFADEKANPEVLSQDDFSNCLERATEGMRIATVRENRILALATAYHRVSYHNEERSVEITGLEDQLSPEDIAAGMEAGQSRDFWNP